MKAKKSKGKDWREGKPSEDERRCRDWMEGGRKADGEYQLDPFRERASRDRLSARGKRFAGGQGQGLRLGRAKILQGGRTRVLATYGRDGRTSGRRR